MMNILMQIALAWFALLIFVLMALPFAVLAWWVAEQNLHAPVLAWWQTGALLAGLRVTYWTITSQLRT